MIGEGAKPGDATDERRGGRQSVFHRTSLWAACAVLAACAGQAHEADDDLGRAVKRVLYDNESMNLLHVEVSTSKAVVYLSGEVDEYLHKEEAERLSRAVDRVRGVVNKVQVEP